MMCVYLFNFFISQYVIPDPIVMDCYGRCHHAYFEWLFYFFLQT